MATTIIRSFRPERFLWGDLQNKVYKSRHPTIEELGDENRILNLNELRQISKMC